MKELLPQIRNWMDRKTPVVLARVIQTWGSSPRPVGSVMLISDTMEMAGSVSGGCVEGAVLKEAKVLLGEPTGKIIQYGVSDEDAWAVGLSCGGKIQVYLQPWLFADTSTHALAVKLNQLLTDNVSCALITALSEGHQSSIVESDGTHVGSTVPPRIVQQALVCLDQRKHATVEADGTTYFIQVFPRRSQMIIVGAAHITADLIQLAHSFDFETVVIDPRSTFAQSTTFAVRPDRIFEKYPSEVLPDLLLDENTYAVILSHDPKIDDDALQIILKKKVAYVGALGSKKNHEKRVQRLQEHGLSPEEIGSIDAPIGLDIKAQGAREIAFSIMGAVLKAKNQFR